MAKGKNQMSTSQLLNVIRKSGSFAQVEETFSEMDEQPVFCHYLYEVLNRHQKSSKSVIEDCGIERSYFYHILNGQKMPSLLFSVLYGVTPPYFQSN